MTMHPQHQDTATDFSPPPSWPRAGPPTAAAPVAGDAGGGAISVASAIVIFVAISTSLLSLQYFYDVSEWDRGTRGARPRPRRGDDGTAGSNGGGTRTRGVDPELLRSLPVTVYRAGAPGLKGDAVECSVCLAELENGEEARFLPRCGHGFHVECIDMWLASNTTCPLCRLTVSKPDTESSRTPASSALALRSFPPEPATTPRNVLVGVTIQGAVTAKNVASDDTSASVSTTAAAALVIEIPEVAPVPTPTPREMAKSSPVFARPRSFRRLWSFGRQGPTSSSCCTCAGEVADVEQGVCITVGVAVAEAEAQLPSETTAGAAQGSAV